MSSSNGRVITVYKSCKAVRGKNVPAEDFIATIRQGEPRYMPLINKIREESDHNRRQILKQNSPGATLSGTFKNRSNKGLKKHSGLIPVDVDDVKNPEEIKRMVLADKELSPTIYAAFFSVSGKGLCFVHVIDGSKHLESFLYLEKYYREKFNITVDAAAKDVARFRYLSYDPNLHFNSNAKELIVPSVISKEKTTAEHPKNDDYVNATEGWKMQVVTAITDSQKLILDDYKDYLNAALAIAHGLGEGGREEFHRLSSLSAKYSREECDEKFNNCLKTGNGEMTFGTLIHMAKEVGIDIPPLPKKKSSAPDETAPPEQKIRYLNGIRRREKGEDALPKSIVKQQVCEYIVNDLRKLGNLFYNDEGSCWWFQKKTQILYEMQKTDTRFTTFLNNEYRCNATEAEFSFLLRDLEAAAITSGCEVKVHRFAYFDAKTHTLYIANTENEMYRLDGEEIVSVPNGTESVFFTPGTNLGGVKYIPDHINLFEDLIVNTINFSTDKYINLTPGEQCIIFKVWFLSLFFESLQPTKPIQLFVGEKGSGKTSQQRKIGVLLFGNDFNVTSITKEDDFDATISGNYFIAFDNVDAKIDWLCDRLAHTATGKHISKRELYTTNRMVKFKPRCFLSLNARTPEFKRDDVVDRLLLFRVERLQNFKSERSILKEILETRNDILSEIFDDLNLIINHMQITQETKTSSHRMADFVELGWKIASAVGCGEQFLDLMNKTTKDQTDFLVEDNPVFTCLSLWVNNGNEGRFCTAGELFSVFQKVALDNNVPFNFKSALAFGKTLKNMISNLRQFFSVKVERDTIKNVPIYAFKRK